MVDPVRFGTWVVVQFGFVSVGEPGLRRDGDAAPLPLPCRTGWSRQWGMRDVAGQVVGKYRGSIKIRLMERVPGLVSSWLPRGSAKAIPGVVPGWCPPAGSYPADPAAVGRSLDGAWVRGEPVVVQQFVGQLTLLETP